MVRIIKCAVRVVLSLRFDQNPPKEVIAEQFDLCNVELVLDNAGCCRRCLRC